MPYPVQKEDVIWRRVGDTIVVIDEDGLSSHVLNKTASFIWELCDGKKNIDDIASKINEHFEVSLEDARDDTVETIENLSRAGILINNKGINYNTRKKAA